MTELEVSKLSRDELLDAMRRETLPVEHSFFATVHHKSADRPNGFDADDLDQISEDLEDGDVLRWRRQLSEHFAKKGA